MKTTMDIDDDLFIATKAAAAQRHTTMKAIIEHALRREINPGHQNMAAEEPAACYKTGKHGLPVLKRSDDAEIRSETIYQMMEEEGI